MTDNVHHAFQLAMCRAESRLATIGTIGRRNLAAHFLAQIVRQTQLTEILAMLRAMRRGSISESVCGTALAIRCLTSDALDILVAKR